MTDPVDEELIPLTPLSRKQRRVLGVLVEKAFTVPDQYPLTLKATTTACNQKNNREPVTNYSEDDVAESLEQLQALGFVGCLHTESGRTERYRHYLRMRTKLNGAQIAILTELLLRGKQQLGELRTRASRMVQVNTQEDLRRELQSLMDAGLIRSNGPLERRGIEVDHSLYADGEKHEPLSAWSGNDSSDVDDETESVPIPSPVRSNSATPTHQQPQSPSRDQWDRMDASIRELKGELETIRADFRELQTRFDDLQRQLGG